MAALRPNLWAYAGSVVRAVMRRVSPQQMPKKGELALRYG